MNGNKLLADTNIVIYLLDGDRTVAELLDNKTVHVSFVTQLELLSYSDLSDQDEVRIKEFLEQCIIIDINPSIKEETIRIRKLHRLKLPDSIIIASALYLDIPLITSDQGLQKVEELSLVSEVVVLLQLLQKVLRFWHVMQIAANADLHWYRVKYPIRLQLRKITVQV